MNNEKVNRQVDKLKKLYSELENYSFDEVIMNYSDEEIMDAFHWEVVDNLFSPIIKDDNVVSFLKLLLDEDEELYSEFSECFFSDVIMSLLNEALNEILQYFNGTSKKTKIKKNLELVNDVFFDEVTFEKIITEYIAKFNFLDEKSIFDKIDKHEGMHMQIPKVILPWYLFILNSTAEFSGVKIQHLKENHLSLMRTESDYPIEYKVFEKSQEGFHNFMELMKITSKDAEINSSLNLFDFNAVTNLYDLYNLVNIFKEDSDYMKRQKLSPEESSYDENKEIRFGKKNRIFSEYGHIALFDAISTKTFMTDRLTKPVLFSDLEIHDIFQRIFLGSKNSLRELIESEVSDNDKYDNVEKEIKTSYGVYRAFVNYNPYGYLIDIQEKDINIYKTSGNNEDVHLYEAYGIAYKILYNAKKKSKKV